LKPTHPNLFIQLLLRTFTDRSSEENRPTATLSFGELPFSPHLSGGLLIQILNSPGGIIAAMMGLMGYFLRSVNDFGLFTAWRCLVQHSTQHGFQPSHRAVVASVNLSGLPRFKGRGYLLVGFNIRIH
jgi:hypothetical protein